MINTEAHSQFKLLLLFLISTFWVSTLNFSNNETLAVTYSDEIPYGISLIGADTVWSLTQGSQEVIVAVLDSGVNTTHFDLENVLWANLDEISSNGVDDDLNGYIDDTNGWDFVNHNNDPFSLLDTADENLKSHGTHVVGTIVAQLNDLGIAGVAPNVSIMPLRVVNKYDRNPDIGVAEAIRYATDNGANIISMSIGIYDVEITNSTSYQLVEEALQYADSKNLLIVASAGNEGGLSPIRPANSEYVIAVGAVDSDKNLASFSNRGSEIVAPGVNVKSTIPYNEFRMASGTSMAAPHVSGALALILSYNDSLSNIEARTLLQQTATDLGPEGWDSEFGYGIINLTKAFQFLSESNDNGSTNLSSYPNSNSSNMSFSTSTFSETSTTSTTNLPITIFIVGITLVIIYRRRN
ncbi:MAG: S8 family peptidase [Candidatus Hodarchaeales archaeon]|jgi:subtilisin family serine protease